MHTIWNDKPFLETLSKGAICHDIRYQKILYVDKINRSPCAGMATHRFPTSSRNQSPTKIITTQLIPHNIFSCFI